MDIKWLAEQLERPGLSQAGLAKALGKSPSAISRILSGERQLKAAEVPVILRYVGAPTAPPSDDDLLAYHAALGAAVSEWNILEIELSGLFQAAFGTDREVQDRMLLAVFEAVREHPLRLEMLNRILNISLATHPNEMDWWADLVVRIRAAGRRRDAYTRSATTHTNTGDVFGYNSDLTQGVTVTQLREDARHFRNLKTEVIRLQQEIMQFEERAENALT